MRGYSEAQKRKGGRLFVIFLEKIVQSVNPNLRLPIDVANHMNQTKI